MSTLAESTFSLSLLKMDLVDLELIFRASNDDVAVASLADSVAAAALTAFTVELPTDKLWTGVNVMTTNFGDFDQFR
jgi:hypothetical protein